MKELQLIGNEIQKLRKDSRKEKKKIDQIYIYSRYLNEKRTQNKCFRGIK